MARLRQLGLGVCAAVLLAAAGSASVGGPLLARGARVWQTIEVVAPDAGGTAVRVDVVLVQDVAWMGRLPVSGPQWFAARQELQLAAAKAMQVISLEVPPQSAVRTIPLPAQAGRAAGALVYVDLPAGPGLPGALAAPLAPHRCVRLTLTGTALAQTACP